MKKLAILALVLSLGLVSVGCNKPDAKKGDKAPGAAMDSAKMGAGEKPADGDAPKDAPEGETK